jgi:hypothetical protein
MSTAVAKMPASATALVSAMEQAASAIRQASGDMPYLRLLTSGEWVFGGDDNDVEVDSLWACDPASFCLGFQAWGTKSDLLGEVMHLVTDQPILRSDLEDVGAEWKTLMACSFVCISGSDEGTQVLYKVTSKGGIKAIGKLMQELVARIKSAPKDGTYIPVVKLGVDHYKHASYGRTYVPMLTVEEWTDEDELSAGVNAEAEDDDMLEDDEPEVVEEPTPKVTRKPRTKKAVEPEPEEEELEVVEPEPEEDPAPKRRRRARK